MRAKDKKFLKKLTPALLFTPFTAAYAQKSQNSDFAHVCLGFVTQNSVKTPRGDSK